MLRRIILLISIALLATSLSGCFLKGYRYDVQQGNVITLAQLHSIKPGMRERSVIKRLGAPILRKLYLNNQMSYVYTMKPGGKPYHANYLIIYFRQGRVTHIKTNMLLPSPHL